MRFTPPLPTSRDDIVLVYRVLRLVLTRPRYAVVAMGLFPTMLLLFVAPRNAQLLVDTVFGGTLPLTNRIQIVVGLIPLVGDAGYPVATAGLLYAAALVVAVNITLLLYHAVEHDLSPEEGAGSTLGTLLGMLGAGCASCGSALLAGVLSLLGLSGSLTLLPLDGAEVLLVALAVACLSIYWIANALRGGTIRGEPLP